MGTSAILARRRRKRGRLETIVYAYFVMALDSF